MTRALVALMLLLSAGGGDLARPAAASHQAAPITAAPAPRPARHVIRRANRSLHRAALPKVPAARRKLQAIATLVQQATYMPLVQCWNGEVLVDHPNQTDCPPRPKPSHTSESYGSGADVHFPAPWQAVADCESLGDGSWRPSSDSFYRGYFQFDRSIWRMVGGSGDPALASPAEQLYRARKLLSIQGWIAWPVCSRRVGLR